MKSEILCGLCHFLSFYTNIKYYLREAGEEYQNNDPQDIIYKDYCLKIMFTYDW